MATLALALFFAVGCETKDVWVEELPEAGDNSSEVRASDTWIDLLKLATEPLDGSPSPSISALEFREWFEPGTPKEEMERGREGILAVLSDQRHAWQLPVKGTAGFEVHLERGGRLRVSFGIQLAENGSLPEEVTVGFAVDLITEDESVGVARGEISKGEQARWIDVATDITGPGRLRFTVTVRGELEAELTAAFGTPSLEVEQRRAPDVILVSVDTLRADRLGCYGYERDTSPNIDRLAAKGVVFENCMSQSPWTLPSYGSLFTSLYPGEHRAGVTDRAEVWTTGGDASKLSKTGHRLIDEVPTLATALSGSGYRTAGFYFNPYLTPQTGMSRGFDEYMFLRYSANAGVDRALEWLEQNEGLPRFVFLQLFDPHWPYSAPAPYDQKFSATAVESIEGYPWALSDIRDQPQSDERKALLSDHYDGEIAYTDAELGRLFEYFERADATDQPLILFQSDHGEEFWDHGRFEHGHSMHTELLRVPLLISMPSTLAPSRVRETVRTIDVFPTVMDLLGLGAPEGLAGSSLVSKARGEQEGVHLVGFAESILWGRPYAPYDEAKVLVVDGWKLVKGDGKAPTQLFRLLSDPGEQKNLAGENPHMVELLMSKLEAKVTGAREAGDGELLEFDQREQDQLHGLGYTGEGDDESD